jgi:hypothetical protein
VPLFSVSVTIHSSHNAAFLWVDANINRLAEIRASSRDVNDFHPK